MIDRNTVEAKLAELDRRVRRIGEVRRAEPTQYAVDEAASELTAFDERLPK